MTREVMYCNVRQHWCDCEPRCEDWAYEPELPEPKPERDEDARLDSPTHGQASGINRENRGRE